MLGSFPYNMSDMQSPTVGPLWALPAAKADSDIIIAPIRAAKGSNLFIFIIGVSPYFLCR
jgi:hypothetical protein